MSQPLTLNQTTLFKGSSHPIRPVVATNAIFFCILAFFGFFFAQLCPLQFHFKKMDPNLIAIIIVAEVTHSDASTIGANFSYVADDVASLRGSAP
jgi:hypothetical protein